MSITRKQLQSYFITLESLTVETLDRSAQRLVRGENESIARLIAHLAEMSDRKTALEMGYRSLYDYCIRRLHLSESAVPARVQVASVCRRFPELLTALSDGHVSLTVAGLLAPHLNVGNASRLIADCAGMTRREAEEYLVALGPTSAFEPSVCPRPPPRRFAPHGLPPYPAEAALRPGVRLAG